MSLITSHPGGEARVCELNDALDLSQPTISHHLKALYDSGLLDRESAASGLLPHPHRGPGQPRRTDRPPVTLSRPGMNSRPHGASSPQAAPDGFTG
jgi:Bacterial regulatory protein, arsR family